MFKPGDLVSGTGHAGGSYELINDIVFKVRGVVPLTNTDTSYLYIDVAVAADTTTAGYIYPISRTFIVGQNLSPFDQAPESKATIQASSPKDLTWAYTIDTLGTTKVYAHCLVKKLVTLKDGMIICE